MLTFVAGAVFAHLFWLLAWFGVMLWENRGGVQYTRRPSDP